MRARGARGFSSEVRLAMLTELLQSSLGRQPIKWTECGLSLWIIGPGYLGNAGPSLASAVGPGHGATACGQSFHGATGMDSIGNLVASAAKGLVSRGSRSSAPALSASTAKAPTYFDRYVEIELPKLFSAWIPNAGPRGIRRALSDTERQAVEARADELRGALHGYLDSERDAVEAAIAAMLGGFRSMKQDGESAEGIVIVSAGVLRPFPLWAIEKGCLKIARGDTDLDRRFAPNDTEIYAVIDVIVKEYQKALATVEALLRAPVEIPCALPSPPPVTESDIENRLALIGRPLSTGTALEKRTVDGKHAERVAADLERRRKPEAAA